MTINFEADFSAQNQSTALAQKQAKAEQHNEQTQVSQSQMTGLAWQTQNVQNPAAVDAAAQAGGKETAFNTKSQPSIAAPSFEDVVVFSSVDTSEKVSAYKKLDLVRLGFNLGALEDAYREAFKKSKSHNYLLERFMASVKFSSLKLLFSLLGVPAEEQDRIQKEVRKQVLKEIDDKLKKEWAYTKAMLDIVG